MPILKFSTTVKSKATDTSIIPIKDGQFLIVTDTKQLMYDFGATRVTLGDIIELETETDRTSLVTPLDKFYFVKSTGVLWRYNGGTWLDMSSGSGCATYSYTISANAWSNKTQTVSIAAVTATSNGFTSVAQNISALALDACLTANITIVSQAAGSITLKANGDVPTVDIPAVLFLFD